MTPFDLQSCLVGMEKTMLAIIQTESNFQPFVIGINGDIRLPHQPKTKGEAVFTANWLINHGYNIDLGVGQINSANLHWKGLSVEDAFDPCKNAWAASEILTSNYQSARKSMSEQEALNAAISQYNTGSKTMGFQNGYVEKVRRNGGGVDAPGEEKKELTPAGAPPPARASVNVFLEQPARMVSDDVNVFK
jgi:type IV secretion system protein VirB1